MELATTTSCPRAGNRTQSSTRSKQRAVNELPKCRKSTTAKPQPTRPELQGDTICPGAGSRVQTTRCYSAKSCAGTASCIHSAANKVFRQRQARIENFVRYWLQSSLVIRHQPIRVLMSDYQAGLSTAKRGKSRHRRELAPATCQRRDRSSHGDRCLWQLMSYGCLRDISWHARL